MSETKLSYSNSRRGRESVDVGAGLSLMVGPVDQ